ncbi:MAG: hypothetical protein DI533_08510 [Cereibacter sphaeroides]|uniref:Uncharacterized protein n=1 Tax=Cereibacter sphaeroides TaxID=1063 RepID=A0A2W5SFD4_CERSP|nr:MAG: hypothetical protein DI533_08510 [Cereibacter sphaeroides]
MPLSDLLVSQLTDPFRIGLIIALLYTALRNRAVTGQIGPLLAGIAFVAIIIPTVMQTSSTEPLMRLIVSGLASNAIILGVVWGLWTLLQRLRG